jgi:hypothetical protein
MTFKARLTFFYLLAFGVMAALAILFFLKWYFIAWLFYFVPLLCRKLIHPFPKVYTNIYNSRIVIACLVIFSIAALFVAATSVLYPLSAKRETINAYVLIAAFPFFIPVIVMTIREEVKYAIKADAETSVKQGVN